MARKKNSKTAEAVKIPTRTLLLDFTEQAGLSFVAPQRVGKKKGDLIGFNRAKTDLVLSFLCAVPASLNDRAKMVNANYSLVRRWVNEPAFNDMVSSTRVKFIEFFMDYVRKWHKRSMEFYEKDAKQPIANLLEYNNDPKRFEHMGLLKAKIEGEKYHPILLGDFAKVIAAEMDKAVDKADPNYLLTLAIVTDWLVAPEHGNEELKKRVIDHHRTVSCHTLDLAKKAILKAAIPIKVRKDLVMAICVIQQSIRAGLM